MEVGGQTSGEDLMASYDQEPPVFCRPCGNEGERIEAKGYCQTCDEYLCGTCYSCHKRLPVLMHNVLLDKTTMPTPNSTNQSSKLSLCTLPCPDHTGKVMEYLCPTHNISLCVVCSTTKHKACEVEYIPELKTAVNYKDSAEYKTIISRLHALQTHSDKLIDDTKAAIEEIEDNVNAKIEEMEEFRDEIVARVNQHIKKLSKQAIIEKEVNQSSQQNLAKAAEKLKDEAIQSEQKLIALVNETSNLLAASKKALEQVDALENILVNNKIPEISFKKNADLQRLVTSDEELGKLEVSYKPRDLYLPSTTNPTPARPLDFTNVVETKKTDIDTKTKDDATGPWITGLAYVHPDTLLAADNNSNNIKIVNITSNTVTSQLSLPSKPLDITLLPGNKEAAVTMPDQNRIQVISTSGQLSCLRSIPVGGQCRGICSTNSSFFVSFTSPPMVQVIDFTGKVCTTIDTDVNGKQLFLYPYYVSIAEEDSEEKILVSDYKTNTITKLTMQGKVATSYKRGTWNGVLGIEPVGGKQVLVCNQMGPAVLEEDKNNVVTLLDNWTHGIKYPRALCYYSVQSKLYFSHDLGPIIWVFDIHPNK